MVQLVLQVLPADRDRFVGRGSFEKIVESRRKGPVQSIDDPRRLLYIEAISRRLHKALRSGEPRAWTPDQINFVRTAATRLVVLEAYDHLDLIRAALETFPVGVDTN